VLVGVSVNGVITDVVLLLLLLCVGGGGVVVGTGVSGRRLVGDGVGFMDVGEVLLDR
jgi:hypothetical protein